MAAVVAFVRDQRQDFLSETQPVVEPSSQLDGRDFSDRWLMSALPPIATNEQTSRKVSKGHKSDSYSTIFQYESLRITLPLRNV